MVDPSGVSSFFRSDKMRAVMLTDVAVDITPRKMHEASKNPYTPGFNIGNSHMPIRSPVTKDTITPPRPTSVPATA